MSSPYYIVYTVDQKGQSTYDRPKIPVITRAHKVAFIKENYIILKKL